MKQALLVLSLTLFLAFSVVSGNAAEVKAKASVDPAQVGEPISPFIYGQFIEHLGRCIYGGIWSEMLQDRKFYDAPALEPWELVGETPARHCLP